MADVVAAMGVGVTIGAAAYTHAGGFVARHETVRSQQSTEIQQQVTNFEAAYERGEVRGRDWQEYRSIRAVARQKESEYERSIEAYKETPNYHYITKHNKKREVRKKKKEFQGASRSLRQYYSAIREEQAK